MRINIYVEYYFVDICHQIDIVDNITAVEESKRALSSLCERGKAVDHESRGGYSCARKQQQSGPFSRRAGRGRIASVQSTYHHCKARREWGGGVVPRDRDKPQVCAHYTAAALPAKMKTTAREGA